MERRASCMLGPTTEPRPVSFLCFLQFGITQGLHGLTSILCPRHNTLTPSGRGMTGRRWEGRTRIESVLEKRIHQRLPVDLSEADGEPPSFHSLGGKTVLCPQRKSDGCEGTSAGGGAAHPLWAVSANTRACSAPQFLQMDRAGPFFGRPLNNTRQVSISRLLLIQNKRVIPQRRGDVRSWSPVSWGENWSSVRLCERAGAPGHPGRLPARPDRWFYFYFLFFGT